MNSDLVRVLKFDPRNRIKISKEGCLFVVTFEIRGRHFSGSDTTFEGALKWAMRHSSSYYSL